MIIGLLLFIVRFLYVFSSAFQQKSVIQNRYKAIPISCYIRSATEYISIALVAYSTTTFTGPWSALFEILLMGTGATLGVFAGMFLHDKIYKKEK